MFGLDDFFICLLFALECRSNFKTAKEEGVVQFELSGLFSSLCKKACGIWHLKLVLPDVIANTVKFLLKCFESFKCDIDNRNGAKRQ